MNDQNLTREELIAEIHRLRRRVAMLEDSQGKDPTKTTSAGEAADQAASDRDSAMDAEAFQKMFRDHGAIMYIVDFETLAIIDANKTALNFYGYDLETMRTKRIPEINIMPEEEIRAEIKRAVAQGRSHYVFQHQLATGEIRDVEVYANPISIKGREHTFAVVHDITERKRAEEDLAQIFAMAMDMLCIADINTATFLKVNPAFTEILGFSEQELLNSPFFDFIHPDDIDATMTVVQEQLRKGANVINFENRYRCKDGSYRWLSWVSHPNVEKGVTYAVARDITEMKQKENALQRSKALLDATGHMAKVGGWELDARTLEVTWTDETYHIHELPLNYQPPLEEAINFFHPQDRSRLEKAIERALKHGEPYDMEIRFITAKGKKRWTRTKCQPVIENGQTVKLWGTFQDISARKKAELELQASEEQFRHFFEHLTIGVAVYEAVDNGEDFIFADINPAGQQTNKVSIDEIRGERLTRVFPSVRELGLFQALQDTWRTGEPRLVPFSKYKDERITQWVENRVFRLPSGKVVAVYDDRTELMRLEEGLRQAQKMEAIGTLAGGIAHDFNNMLSVLTGNISYALSILDKDDELSDILADVLQATKQAQNLTHQLLTFAKGGEPIKKACDMNKLVEESARFVTSGSKSKCDFNLADDLLAAEIDSGQINQVLSNIIINAYQAMPNGGVITIQSENIEIDTISDFPLASGPYIRISIEDQGIGIHAKHIPNIFDPYFTTKQKGSGLGLATAYSIVKRHGGNITVYSESGKGTVFHIYLPASSKHVLAAENKAPSSHQGHGKILIMDDQEAILKMVSRMFAKMGYETEAATDGAKAIEIYREAYQAGDPFDLVILDLTVPGGMGGAKTVIELLKIDPDAKAVVSSGYSNAPIMANYQDYGFRGVVPKPYTKAHLADVLNRILG